MGNMDSAAPAVDWRACFRQPKVEQLCAPLCQHDVPGLQVAMDDAGFMSSRERIRDLDGVLECLVERERTFLQPLL